MARFFLNPGARAMSTPCERDSGYLAETRSIKRPEFPHSLIGCTALLTPSLDARCVEESKKRVREERKKHREGKERGKSIMLDVNNSYFLDTVQFSNICIYFLSSFPFMLAIFMPFSACINSPVKCTHRIMYWFCISNNLLQTIITIINVLVLLFVY
jgi:hypothetical protein